MSVREWSIKPGELKGMNRSQLLLFGVRLVLRVEPWWAPGSKSAWNDALGFVVAHATGSPATQEEVRGHHRRLNELSAGVRVRRKLPDDVAATCVNYTASALGALLQACLIEDLPRLRKEIILAARQSASIAAVLAHAGRVPVSRGRDAVGVACGDVWAAIRADAALEARAWDQALARKKPLGALRGLGPLFPAGDPAWVAATAVANPGRKKG